MRARSMAARPSPIPSRSRRPGQGPLPAPRVLATRRAVWVAWKEFDGTVSTIRAMRSTDGGAHWAAAQTLAETKNASDQPILIADKGHGYLSLADPMMRVIA